jgi:hypothetical protein
MANTNELIRYKILTNFFNFFFSRWCVSCVSTRQNQILDKKKRPLLAMIPLLDMCNHEDGDVSNEKLFLSTLNPWNKI